MTRCSKDRNKLFIFKEYLQKDLIRASVIYLLLICAAYSPIIFYNKTLSMAARYPWFESLPKDQEWQLPLKYPNTFNVDIGSPAAYEEPIDFFIGNAIKNGSFPLWNPFIACGTVVQEMFSTRSLFPFQLLQNIFSWKYRDFFLLGRLFFAAIGVFIFLKLFGLSFYPSLSGGMMYGFSGAMTVFLTLTQMSNVGMVLPYALIGTELFYRKQNIFSVFCCSLGTSFLILAGQPEVSFYGLIFICTYYIFRNVANIHRNILKRTAAFFSVIFLALLISSPFFVPFLIDVSQYYTLHPPGGTQGVETPTSLVNFMAILLPELLRWRSMISAFTVNAGWDCLGGYIGIAGIFLILVSLRKKWWGRKEYLFFLFFGVFILLKNMGIPVVSRIGRLPVFNQVWTPRWTGPVWNLSLVLAAALGLEAIFSQDQELVGTNKSLRNKLIYLTLIILLCIFNFENQLKHFDTPFKNISEINDNLILLSMRQGIFESVLLGITLLLAIYYAFKMKSKDKSSFGFIISGIIIVEMSFHVTVGYDEIGRMIKLFYHLLAVLFLFFYVFLTKEKNKVSMGLFVFLFSTGMIFVGIAGIKCIPERQNVFISPCNNLKYDNLSRVMGIRGVLFPNSAAVYGIQDIKSIVSLSIKRFQLFQDHCLFTKPQSKYMGFWFTGIMDPQTGQDISDNLGNRQIFYSLAGVSNYLSNRYEDIPNTRLIQDGPIKNYQNLSVFPRAFIVYKWFKASSPENSLNWMLNNPSLLNSEAVVEGEAAPNASLNLPNDLYVKAEIKSYSLHSVVIEAKSDKPGLLILTDTYHPNWTATVDGKRCEVFPVNLCFRGVFLSQGNHEIKFIYFPKVFYICVITSTLTLLTLFILIIKKRVKICRNYFLI